MKKILLILAGGLFMFNVSAQTPAPKTTAKPAAKAAPAQPGIKKAAPASAAPKTAAKPAATKTVAQPAPVVDKTPPPMYGCLACSERWPAAGNCPKHNFPLVKDGDYYCPDGHPNNTTMGNCIRCNAKKIVMDSKIPFEQRREVKAVSSPQELAK